MEFAKMIQTVMINNKLVTATIIVLVDQDDEIPTAPDDFDFGSDKRNKEYAKRFNEGGDLFNAVIRVEASAHGVEGSDVLGGCHIRCNNMFDSVPFNKDVEQIVSMHDMIDNALNELVTNIKERAKELAPFV